LASGEVVTPQVPSLSRLLPAAAITAPEQSEPFPAMRAFFAIVELPKMPVPLLFATVVKVSTSASLTTPSPEFEETVLLVKDSPAALHD